MAGTQEQRLRLTVDAAVSGATSGFGEIADAADRTQRASDQAANSVRTAADRVAAARAKEEDATGRLRVEEIRLQELRDRGRASAAQLAAAEERVEAAQRGVQRTTAAVTRATEDQERATEQATQSLRQQDQALEQTEQSSRGYADQLGNVKTAVGAVAGLGLVSFLRDTVNGYVEGARGAQLFAAATNSSVEEAGQFLTLVGQLGLDLNDLIEIQAEFAQQSSNLGQIGVELQRNADGTVNWTRTLSDTLTQLQQIPDATERNRLGFQFFGEEGYKQLVQLVSGGKSVQEALEQIGVPFTEEDTRKAALFREQLLEVQTGVGGLGRDLGSVLLPLISDAISFLQEAGDVASELPLPLVIATAAAIALGITGFNPLAIASGRVAAAVAAANAQLAIFRVSAAINGTAGAVIGAGMIGAATGASRLLSIVGGPLGAGLIAAAGFYALASSGADDFAESTRGAAASLESFSGSASAREAELDRLARGLQENAGYWERLQAGIAATDAENADTEGFFGGFLDGLEENIDATIGLGTAFFDTDQQLQGFKTGIETAGEEVGAFAAQQETAQTTATGLNDLIAEGTTSGSEFAGAVRTAAEAQAEQSRTSDLATAAIAAYTAQTTGAVDAALNLINAQFGSTNAQYAFQSAVDAANSTVDDGATLVDESAQAYTRLFEASLAAGDAAADAAVASATAAGTIITPLDEANIRADALITNLQQQLNTPGLTDQAKAGIQGLIDQLVIARDSGDIEATLTTLGVGEATSEIDTATEDRDTTVRVESRNGPAVISYLNGIASATRLALITTESRGGPAVIAYLNGIASATRLALIATESRGGPAVAAYLNSIAAQTRLSLIFVETRGGPGVEAYLNNLARTRTAVINVRQNAPSPAPNGPASGPAMARLFGAGGGDSYTVQQLIVQPQVDGGGNLSSAALENAGGQIVSAVAKYRTKNPGAVRRALGT